MRCFAVSALALALPPLRPILLSASRRISALFIWLPFCSGKLSRLAYIIIAYPLSWSNKSIFERFDRNGSGGHDCPGHFRTRLASFVDVIAFWVSLDTFPTTTIVLNFKPLWSAR